MNAPLPESVRVLSAIIHANLTPEVKKHLFDTYRPTVVMSPARRQASSITVPTKAVALNAVLSV